MPPFGLAVPKVPTRRSWLTLSARFPGDGGTGALVLGPPVRSSQPVRDGSLRGDQPVMAVVAPVEDVAAAGGRVGKEDMRLAACVEPLDGLVDAE